MVLISDFLGEPNIKKIKNMPNISVIVPTYKPGDYIVKCLDSLCNQSLDHHLYEIMIILNGVKLPFLDTLTVYVHSHQETNIRILYTERGGVSNARNLGIEASKGDYLAFVDDDDWVTPDYFEALLKIASRDTVAVSNAVEVEEYTHNISQHYFWTDAFKRCYGLRDISFFKGRQFLSPVWGKLIHRDIIGATRFPIDFALGEDSLFMFIISANIKHLALTNEDSTYFLHKRQDSVSHRKYSYNHRVRVALQLCLRYTLIYSKGITRYDFPLFLSRVIATLKKLFKRRYE